MAIPIQKPWFEAQELGMIGRTLESGWVTQGPMVKQFEDSFANRIGVNYTVAVNSCASALLLSLKALGIGPGDEVLVPAFTHCSTANVVELAGATTRFVDIDPDTYNIDPAACKAAVTEHTKAIIAVHLFGLSADMKPLSELAKTRGLFLIEDAACAHTAEYRKRPVGGIGDVGCFSFHPRKLITTGEGGMIATNDHALFKRVQVLRSHGETASDYDRHLADSDRLPDVTEPSTNFRMTDIQGALGLAQLGRLSEILRRRRLIVEAYQKAFKSIEGLALPEEPKGYVHVYQSYVVRVRPERIDRTAFTAYLREREISTRPGTQAVHTLTYYREKYGIQPEDFPNALAAREQTVTLPLYAQMSPDERRAVIDAVQAAARAASVEVKI